jgi:5-methylcytosine-specific restriction endonuclease McrA
MLKVLSSGRRDKAFLRRARELTHRQFYREARFLLHLRQCFPELAARFWRPLPQPGLEKALMQELNKEGVKSKDIEEEFHKRRIEPLKVGCSLDPAENPVVMQRLEVLLDLLVSTHWEDPPEAEDRLLPRDRQTFGHSRRPVSIRFRVPAEVAADWRAAIEDVRSRLGPFAPAWKAALVLFAHAYREWSKVEPESEPTQKKILERDRYLCQVPACPKRCTCEAHHMRPRSQGGSNKLTNIVTLCHTDHQDVIHAGYAKVSGEAPQALRWELGCRPGKESMLELRGERIVGGSRARL